MHFNLIVCFHEAYQSVFQFVFKPATTGEWKGSTLRCARLSIRVGFAARASCWGSRMARFFSSSRLPSPSLVRRLSASSFAGPKDIPVIARAAGRFSGKAVGYIQSARGQLDNVMQRSQVTEVHKELRDTMAQLEAIRQEINSGISILKPGPVTRHILKVHRHGATMNFESSQDMKYKRSPETSDQELLKAHWVPLSKTEELQQTSAAHSSIPQRVSSPLDTMPPSSTRTASPSIVVKPVGILSLLPAQCPPDSNKDTPDITVLPISAASAGLLHHRPGFLSGGADLVLESIVERKVAFDTREFFRLSESAQT